MKISSNLLIAGCYLQEHDIILDFAFRFSCPGYDRTLIKKSLSLRTTSKPVQQNWRHFLRSFRKQCAF